MPDFLLPLGLPPTPSTPDPRDFVVTQGNALAYAAVQMPTLRQLRAVWIYGAAGTGKTHLLSVAKASLPTAVRLTPRTLISARVPQLFGAHVFVDDADRVTDQELLMHTINAVQQDGGILIFTARALPGCVGFTLPPLLSRLVGFAPVMIEKSSPTP